VRVFRAAVRTALLVLCVTPAWATEVKLWPLFRYKSDPATDQMRWTALGPFLEFRRSLETRDLFVRPFLHLHQKRGGRPDDRSEILYPLASTRWQDDYQSFRFLLFSYRTRPLDEPTSTGETAPSAWTSRWNLFPFVFYRHSPERGTRFSVVPFYLDLDDFLGYEHVKMVMFPAYLRLTEPRVEHRWYGFPFVSTVGGPDGRGVRVFPFYGDDEIVGVERTRYVMWPFHVRHERLVPGYGWEQRQVDFPVFASIDGAGRSTRTWGVTAYTHTIDERNGIEHVGAPWPFVVRQRNLGEDEYHVWRLFPFYGRSDRRGISSRFYAWPAYRTKRQDVDEFHYWRRDALLLLWRRQHLHNEVSGRDEDLLTIAPLLRSEWQDGRAFGQMPALVDSLIPKNRGTLALWAPLYALFRWDTRPTGERDWNLFWGLVAREGGALRGPWHLELSEPVAPGEPRGS
jgi:hypothetical protein